MNFPSIEKDFKYLCRKANMTDKVINLVKLSC